MNQKKNPQKNIFQSVGYKLDIRLIPIVPLIVLASGLFSSLYLLPSVTGLKYTFILNTVLYAVSALLISYLAGKAYFLRGSMALLFLGQGLNNKIIPEQAITDFLLEDAKDGQASFYKNIMGQARDIILVVHVNGKILEANQEAVLAYGYTRAKLLSTHICELRAPETSLLVDAQMKIAHQQGLLFRTVHVRSTGEQFPVEVSSRRVRVLDGEALVSIIRDITEAIGMETALRNSEEKYRILHKVVEKDNQYLEEKVRIRTAELEDLNQILNMEIQIRKGVHEALTLRDKEYKALLAAIPDQVFEVEKAGMIRSARGNGDWKYKRPEEYVGKNIFEVVPSSLALKILDNIQQVIRTKTMRTFEFDIMIDNEQFIRETRIVSYKDDEALVVIRDITEEKQAEAKMIEASKLVDQGQKLAFLGIMATSLAHEINQPLNSIKVSASGVVYAHNHGANPTKADMIIELAWISEQADRIDDIIKNIRMFVKDDYSHCQPISLQGIIEQAMQTLSSQPLFQEVVIKIHIDDNLPPILANAVHLQQVVTNLMINAAQSLLASPLHPRMIEIKVWAHDVVIMEVIDNGMGLSEDMNAAIFEPFFTTNIGPQALGLGLAIVQTIVNAYGGRIKAYNNDLGGATFHLEFPRITVRQEG